MCSLLALPPTKPLGCRVPKSPMAVSCDSLPGCQSLRSYPIAWSAVTNNTPTVFFPISMLACIRLPRSSPAPFLRGVCLAIASRIAPSGGSSGRERFSCGAAAEKTITAHNAPQASTQVGFAYVLLRGRFGSVRHGTALGEQAPSGPRRCRRGRGSASASGGEVAARATRLRHRQHRVRHCSAACTHARCRCRCRRR
jgi:hypothetical protein